MTADDIFWQLVSNGIRYTLTDDQGKKLKAAINTSKAEVHDFISFTDITGEDCNVTRDHISDLYRSTPEGRKIQWTFDEQISTAETEFRATLKEKKSWE